MTLKNTKIVSVFLVGLLLVSAFGVVQADSMQKKDGKMHPHKAVFEVEHMTIHNWSVYVGPDDTPDRTVYVDPISISDKTFHVNSKNWMKAGGMANLAAMPAKKQAKARAKDSVDRKKGETVRICIKRIELKNVKVVAKLPEKMPKDMQSMVSDQQSAMSGGPQLPSYQITIHRMNIKRWSFIVGPDDTPNDTVTLGDVTLEDRTILLGSPMKDKRSKAAMQSFRQQIKSGMMKKGAKKGSTYRIVVQNIHLHDVKLVAGNSDEMDDSDETQSTTQTRQSTTQKTTTTEQGMTTTTADSSEDSGPGSDDSNSSNSSGQPGFGITAALIACLGAALLATRKR